MFSLKIQNLKKMDLDVQELILLPEKEVSNSSWVVQFRLITVSSSSVSLAPSAE